MSEKLQSILKPVGMGHFCFKASPCAKFNLSYENEFGLHKNKPVTGTHFRMNGFAPRLVLTQRQKATPK